MPRVPCHSLLSSQVSSVLCIRKAARSLRTTHKMAGLDHLVLCQCLALVLGQIRIRTLHFPRLASLARYRHGSLALLGIILVLFPTTVVPAPLLVDIICLAIPASVLRVWTRVGLRLVKRERMSRLSRHLQNDFDGTTDAPSSEAACSATRRSRVGSLWRLERSKTGA